MRYDRAFEHYSSKFGNKVKTSPRVLIQYFGRLQRYDTLTGYERLPLINTSGLLTTASSWLFQAQQR